MAQAPDSFPATGRQHIGAWPGRVRSGSLERRCVAGGVPTAGSIGEFVPAGFEFYFHVSQRLRRDCFDSCALLGLQRGARPDGLDQAGNVHNFSLADAAGTLGAYAFDALSRVRDDGIVVVETAGSPILCLAPGRAQRGAALRISRFSPPCQGFDRSRS